ncbi:MAG: hypothetical protein ACRC5C_12725 [Bacilli bacterium]
MKKPHRIPAIHYVLTDELRRETILYTIPNCSFDEISVRKNADYFVYEGKYYAVDAVGLSDTHHLIYVSYENDDSALPDTRYWQQLGLELRRVDRFGDAHQLIKFIACDDQAMVLSIINNDHLYLGDTWYERSSFEVDQDRLTYVLYVK